MKTTLIRLLLPYPALYRVARSIYRFATQAPPTVTEEIRRVLGGRSSVFFVQVGSNDGAQGDPIHDIVVNDDSWRGIFIEPVDFLFERLRKNYGEQRRFVFENVAIGPDKESVTFYYVSEDAKEALGNELPYWWDQLGSFDRNHIIKHLNGRLEPYIVEKKLECESLQSLLLRNGVTSIDLLHIDTEGYDYAILSQLDFNLFKPTVILFEHRHLSDDDKRSAAALLEKNDYRYFEVGGDTLGVRREYPTCE